MYGAIWVTSLCIEKNIVHFVISFRERWYGFRKPQCGDPEHWLTLFEINSIKTDNIDGYIMNYTITFKSRLNGHVFWSFIVEWTLLKRYKIYKFSDFLEQLNYSLQIDFTKTSKFCLIGHVLWSFIVVLPYNSWHLGISHHDCDISKRHATIHSTGRTVVPRKHLCRDKS